MKTRYLILGAGPTGLAVAKSLKSYRINYDHVEAHSTLGGNWAQGVYPSVYTDACKDVMQFPEFPMPSNYPDFLSQHQMLFYLISYAKYFHIDHKIKFNMKVMCIDAIEDNLWRVRFNKGTSRNYNGVIICNGHHWDMRWADLNGFFSGDFIHSKQYTNINQLRNKRVLVIGAGNSAADIACEAARVGHCSVMSVRHTPWIFPKSFMGVPLARNKLRLLPSFFQPLLARTLVYISFGSYKSYNLARPTHAVFDKHPTVSEELPYYLRHGRISIKGDVSKVENRRVWFNDGSHDEFDIIISATGFNLSFPFLPDCLVRTEGNNLKCLGFSVYPDYKGLFFVGWPQVRGGIGALASCFSEAIVNLIRIEEEFNIPSGLVLKSLGNELSKHHLYGANDIYKWVKRHPYGTLKRAAGRFISHSHVNVTTSLPNALK